MSDGLRRYATYTRNTCIRLTQGRWVMVTVQVAGAVFEDYLDPEATGVPSEMGLKVSRWIKRGRGWSVEYEPVSVDVAAELASYLTDRAETQLRQSIEPDERSQHYAAIKNAEKIRKQISVDEGDE